MKQGTIDFLLKPFSMESLMTSIERGSHKDRSRQNELVRDLDIDTARAQSNQRAGHGMNNMSVRAAKLGAKLVIESTPKGTCVRLIFPRPVDTQHMA